MGLDSAQFAGVRVLLDDDGLWRQSEELVRLFRALEALGVREYVRYAPHIVRGLDYYTGTVFEARDARGEFRAILGGGRYDNLVAAVGGAPLAGVGFAMGDMVITLVLERFGHIPAASELAPAPVLVTVFDAGQQAESMRIAAQLRAAGIPTALYPEAAKLGKQLKHAQRIGAPAAVIAGPEEAAAGTVSVKDLARREQYTVAREKLAETLQKILAQNSPS